MTHKETSTLALISLQTCFPNFQLNHKSKGDDCPPPPRPPASYVYAQCTIVIAGTSEASEGGSWPRGPGDIVGEQRFSGCGGAASGTHGQKYNLATGIT